MNLTKKMQLAMEHTIEDYETAIEMLNDGKPVKTVQDWWRNKRDLYEGSNHCALCSAATNRDDDIICKKCPLGPQSTGCGVSGGDVKQTMQHRSNYMSATSYWGAGEGATKDKLLEVLKNRLAFINAKFGKNGWEVS